MAINVNFNNEEAINTKVQDLNYIPTYKEYEKERQENEIERQAYYEDFKMRVENGEFKGDTGEGLKPITTDTNIYDLDTGLYSVEEGVNLTYTEMYADTNQPILVSVKSILKVVKKVVSEKEAYVNYELTTLNPTIDPTHESPIGIYQGFIHLLDFFAVRWWGKTPTFISEKTLINLGNGSLNYELLNNIPKINNVELVGNKTLEDLQIKQEYNANDIHFEDGMTFQEKYDTGELHGADGKDGVGIDTITNYYLASDIGSSGDAITWDGDTTDRPFEEMGDANYYKVSNRIPSPEELIGKTITISDATGSQLEEYVLTSNDIHDIGGGYVMVLYESQMLLMMLVSENEDANLNGTYFMRMELGTNYSYISSLSLGGTGISIDTEGWSETPQAITSTKKYLWNYERITYTDNTSFTSEPHIIGAYGDTGEQGLQGENGKDGEDGYTPVKGVDYFTEADKAEIIEEIAEDKAFADGVKEVSTINFKTGENLLTDNIVTLGAGWTGSLTDGFVHLAGNSEPLTFNIDSMDGEQYIIIATITNIREGAIHLSIGNSYPSDIYGYESVVWGVQSVDGGDLYITPAANWSGTISNLECRKITENGTHEVSVVVDILSHEEIPNHLSGFWDILLGLNALKNSVNTTRCIAIGKDSLGSLKTGGRNIAIGTFSGAYMEYGENNLLIGADSAFRVKQASDCIVIGKGAMQYGKNVKNNIALGASALYGQGDTTETESFNNVAIGHSSGYYNSKHNNIFIGNRAGYFNNDYGNVFIGSGAGGEATYKSNGNRLTIIGQSAGVADGKHRATVIGNQAKSTATNTVAIGAGATANNLNQVVIGTDAVGDKANQVVLGNDNIVETLVKGDLIVRGTDGVKRQIIFNTDGTLGWVTAE